MRFTKTPLSLAIIAANFLFIVNFVNASKRLRRGRNWISESEFSYRRKTETTTLSWKITTYDPITLNVGDSIEFENEGTHNLYKMESEAKMNACDFSGAVRIFPQVYVNTGESEEVYFSCRFITHCDNGQKVKVIFNAAEESPTVSPTSALTPSPTLTPTVSPTLAPTSSPTLAPTASPTSVPTKFPTLAQTVSPTSTSFNNSTSGPTKSPISTPTASPTSAPLKDPTLTPTTPPTSEPIESPTSAPIASPTSAPLKDPTLTPTTSPTSEPIESPSSAPSNVPTLIPTTEVNTGFFLSVLIRLLASL